MCLNVHFALFMLDERHAVLTHVFSTTEEEVSVTVRQADLGHVSVSSV